VEVSAAASEESVSRWLAATTQMLHFTASWVGRAPADDNTVVLSEQEAQRLGVATGDTLRLLET
jgi:arginine N-succinyltransferase